MTCPVCKSNDIAEKIHHFEYFGKPYSISWCKTCDCWFYDPFPNTDYTDDLGGELSIRHYLETTAGIEILATISENFYTNFVGKGQRGLEIGCGFGFISHYLETIHGQKMTAYEPSEYGVKGKELLGLNIIKDYFKSDGEKIYDFAISTEVVEHIPDPVSFLADIRKSLTDDGKLLLSTPNKDGINMEAWQPVDLALLSPGMHTVLFTEQSLKKALLLAGFTHVLIKKQGATLYSIASMSPIKDAELFATDFAALMKYYQRIYSSAAPKSPLQKGLFYRLFRLYVDWGLYKEAAALLKDNPHFFILEKDEILSIQTERDLMKYYSLTDSIIYFYVGILYLNYLVNYEKAALLFDLSFLSCKKRLAIVPHFGIVDSDIVWLAKLHQGIANDFLGKHIEAASCFIEILAVRSSEANMPVPNESLRNDAKNRLKQLVAAL